MARKNNLTEKEEEEKDIKNPGSALGEAIGAYMEMALNNALDNFVSNFSCNFVHKGKINPKTHKATKLLLVDKFGVAFNIDGVITDEKLHPLVVIECKYIRYKKHNRDKGSWICTAHSSIRKTYNSVRSSVAVLAGSWSKSSIAMINSNDINVFVVPFDVITQLLAKHNIKFDWGEKERHIAEESWKKYSQLTNEEKIQIGIDMISVVIAEVEATIARVLDEGTVREVSKVIVEIKTNIGEVKVFEFNSISDALDFLEDFSIEEMLDHDDSFTLFENHYKAIDDEDEAKQPEINFPV